MPKGTWSKGRVRGTKKSALVRCFLRRPFRTILEVLEVPPPRHGLGVGTLFGTSRKYKHIMYVCTSEEVRWELRIGVGILRGHYWPIGDPASKTLYVPLLFRTFRDDSATLRLNNSRKVAESSLKVLKSRGT